jgi:hypothetical protein
VKVLTVAQVLRRQPLNRQFHESRSGQVSSRSMRRVWGGVGFGPGPGISLEAIQPGGAV